MRKSSNFLVLVFSTYAFVKLLSKLVDYYVTSTVPDAIEYYEDDPYYKKK